jgi:hypothetical protein
LPAGNLPTQNPQKLPQDKLLKIFVEDGQNEEQMQKFFASIDQSYHSFIIKILLAKEVFPHDLPTLQENIGTYEKLKKSEVPIEKDINSFNNYATWIQEMNRFTGFDPNAVKCKVDPRKLEGVTLDDSMNGYQIWKVTDVESLKQIGLGTRWCTRRDYKYEGQLASRAEDYIEKYGTIYTITRSGNLIAQFTPNLDELQDTQNKKLAELPQGLNIDKYLLAAKRHVMEWASEELRNNRAFVLEAVKQNGLELQFASKQFRNDKQVVLEAVKQDGDAIRYASEQLKNDKDIVLEAVKQNGLALYYASEQLKNDKDIVLEAVKQNGFAT